MKQIVKYFIVFMTVLLILELVGFISISLVESQPMLMALSLVRLFTICFFSISIFVSLKHSKQDVQDIKASTSPPLTSAIPDDVRIKQSEYLALQSQINPHFLYNTLEGFRSEALLGDVVTVAKMAELLAKFFRYNISNLEQMVTIEDELKNIQNYFKIQQFRFENRLELELIFDGDEALIKSCLTPKLILQPIVENAIHHGIEPLLGKGKITIRLMMYTDRLLLIISDNGVGIETRQLNLLNEAIHQSNFDEFIQATTESGIGISNVNKRIQLLFGLEYGLSFYSKTNVGTDVEIALPVKLRELK